MTNDHVGERFCVSWSYTRLCKQQSRMRISGNNKKPDLQRFLKQSIKYNVTLNKVFQTVYSQMSSGVIYPPSL